MKFGLEESYIKGRISCIQIYRSVRQWRYQNWSKVEISIYQDLSIFLPPCWRERRLILISKKLFTLYGPMKTLFQLEPKTTYSGVVRETALISPFWLSSILNPLSRLMIWFGRVHLFRGSCDICFVNKKSVFHRLDVFLLNNPIIE